MKRLKRIFFTLMIAPALAMAQKVIKLDTALWDIDAKAFVLEKYDGYDAIYLQGGTITPRDVLFLNGTIEYDIYLKNEQSFPGVYFRSLDSGDAEHFYIRPHLSGKPDANQAIPLTNGVSPWQLFFGPRYSFPYEYQYDRWTHVKITVMDRKAQVYLDHSDRPQLSWDLTHEPIEGQVVFTGGNRSGMHLANIKIDPDNVELIDFETQERKPINGIIQSWEISEKFEENRLDDIELLDAMINEIGWKGNVKAEEGTAANISRLVTLRDETPGNTVFAKITIESDEDQVRLFQFGYSDRVVAILNGQPIYTGNNGYRSRDYRYLGTIGLFDSIYLNLRRGQNTLVFAVSESFGGWLITGKLADATGLKIK
ncbi:MAG: hypothetical protein RIF33_23730 [Cyclobacteriaceae bacterium]